MAGVKLRVLKARVISAGDAEGLEEALNEFYRVEIQDPETPELAEAELVSMFYVADYSVLITYTV